MKKCGKPATFEVFWPGRPALGMCEEHATKAAEVGESIGCTIETRPLLLGVGSCVQEVVG